MSEKTFNDVCIGMYGSCDSLSVFFSFLFGLLVCCFINNRFCFYRVGFGLRCRKRRQANDGLVKFDLTVSCYYVPCKCSFWDFGTLDNMEFEWDS